MKLEDIKTIDVQTKEWFDNANGNSYFASIITLNFGMPDEVELRNKFQYGYETQHEYEAAVTISKHIGLSETKLLRYFRDDHGVKVNVSKHPAKMSAVKAI